MQQNQITGYLHNELVGTKISMLNSGFHNIEFKEGASFEQLLRIAIENGQYLDLPDDPRPRSYIENRLKRHINPGRPIIQQLHSERWIQVQERRSKASARRRKVQ